MAFVKIWNLGSRTSIEHKIRSKINLYHQRLKYSYLNKNFGIQQREKTNRKRNRNGDGNRNGGSSLSIYFSLISLFFFNWFFFLIVEFLFSCKAFLVVCLNCEEVCDRVKVEMGLLFSFEYRGFLKLGLFSYFVAVIFYLLTVGLWGLISCVIFNFSWSSYRVVVYRWLFFSFAS